MQDLNNNIDAELVSGDIVLPFSFAERHGVVLSERQGETELLYLKGLPVGVLAEARRVLRQEFTVRQVEQAVFDKALSESYQNDSEAAMQMIEDLGEAVDLSSLIEAIPETGDLLEQEDDAPIIRLINSLMAEATIRQSNPVT